MTDFEKARSALAALVSELDPDVECSISPQASQGIFQVTLRRSGEEEVVKVTEKELLDLLSDEQLRLKIEERVINALDLLPEDFHGDEDEIEDETEDELEEGLEEEEDEDEDEDGEEETYPP